MQNKEAKSSSSWKSIDCHASMLSALSECIFRMTFFRIYYSPINLYRESCCCAIHECRIYSETASETCDALCWNITISSANLSYRPFFKVFKYHYISNILALLFCFRFSFMDINKNAVFAWNIEDFSRCSQTSGTWIALRHSGKHKYATAQDIFLEISNSRNNWLCNVSGRLQSD